MAACVSWQARSGPYGSVWVGGGRNEVAHCSISEREREKRETENSIIFLGRTPGIVIFAFAEGVKVFKEGATAVKYPTQGKIQSHITWGCAGGGKA